jgi:ribosomal-protein-serine acetyltransferase
MLLSKIKPLLSERLSIAPLTKEDINDFWLAVNESLPSLIPWMIWIQEPFTRSYATEIAHEAIHLQFENRAIQFVLRYNSSFIGMVSLNAIDWEEKCADIGYWIHRDYERKGFAQEAVKALSDLALNAFGLKTLSIRCSTRNQNSQKIPEKLGFSLAMKLPGILHYPKEDIGMLYLLKQN